MFKDYDKYLSTSLKVYLFVLIIIFIMKIVGLDYFGLDYQSKLILYVDNKLNVGNSICCLSFITSPNKKGCRQMLYLCKICLYLCWKNVNIFKDVCWKSAS